MSGDKDKIYADASQPATLIDGDKAIDCPTLGEAVVALDHLLADRQSAAMINDDQRRTAVIWIGTTTGTST
jgi:hypothetical protein